MNKLYVSVSKCFALVALIVAVGASLSTQAQVTFSTWHHPPQVTLYATDTDGTAGVGTSAAIHEDDIYSAVINIGFTFNYYGTDYTQCVIGANGNISFDTSVALNYDPWPITAALAGNTSVLNCICGPFCDIYDPAGGEMTYFNTGTAPNRKFVVSYCHDAMYSCTAQYTTTQIIISEGSNTIEVHIGHKDTCSSWNGGYAIVGVQNAAGTASTAAPGRDYPTVWATDHEAWLFTPDATVSSYTVSSEPYAPIPYYTIYWYDSSTGTYLGSGDSLVLTPTVPAVYEAAALSCTDTGTTGMDTSGTGFVALVPPTTSLANLATGKDISIFPNPANESVTIKADGIINRIDITDVLGKSVYSCQYQSKQVTVNTAMLPAGVYLVKINDSFVRRLVKE